MLEILLVAWLAGLAGSSLYAASKMELIQAGPFHEKDYLSKGSIMANEKLVSAIREVRKITGKPIYLIKRFEPLPDSTPIQYLMIAQIVTGYNTAMVWTQTTEIVLDEAFNIVSLTPLGSYEYWQNFYTGEGVGTPR